jgi:putative PEP-CTERM system TPR-repeat lipoprotein
MELKRTFRLRWMGLLAGALLLAGCARSPGQRQARYLESGIKYFEKKDYSRALIQFNNALRINRKDAEPHYRLALTYLELGDPGRASQHLGEATRLNPGHAEAQLKLAQLLLLSRDKRLLERARQSAEAALKSAKQEPEALDTLALAKLELGEPDEAEQHLRQALSKFPAHLNSSVMLMMLQLRRKDLAGAESTLTRAVAQAPKSPEPLVALARLYTALRRLPDAEAQLQRAIQLDPRHGRALLDLALLRLRQGKAAEAEQLYRRIAQLPGREYKPVHAMYLVQAGRIQDAIPEFEDLAKKDPDDRAARSRLVAAYVRVRRFSDAENVLARALKQNPKDVQALMEQASLLLLNRRFADAGISLAQALRIRPDSAQAHHLMARALAGQGHAARQRDELSEALRLDPRLLPARIDLARMFLNTRSPKTALDVLQQAPAGQAGNLGLRVQKNWVLLALGERAQVRKELDTLPAGARVPEFLLQDGLLRYHDKDLAGARSALGEALRRMPEDSRALDAVVLAHGGPRSAAAREKIREHAAQYPKSALVHYYMGRMLMLDAKWADARTAMATAVNLNPALPDPQLAMAQLDVVDKKPEAARAVLQRVLERYPEYAAARLFMGNLEETAGNPGAAIAHYRKIVQIEPRNVLGLNNLAYLLAVHARQPDEALSFAQRAAEMAPDNPAIQDTIGWIYYIKGLYRTALPYLEKAAAGPAGGARRRYHLAMVYLKLGKEERGREVLDSALKLDPNLPEAAMARAMLPGASR